MLLEADKRGEKHKFELLYSDEDFLISKTYIQFLLMFLSMKKTNKLLLKLYI